MSAISPAAQAGQLHSGPRGDQPTNAASSLRSILRDNRTYGLSRVGLLAGMTVTAACTAIALQQAVFGDPWAGIGLLAIAITVASLTSFTVMMLGAAVMTLSMTLAVVATLFMGSDLGVGWALRAMALVAIAAMTALPLRARSPRLPATPTAMVGQWLTPACLSLAPTVGEWRALAIAGSVQVALLAYQGDASKWWSARRASRRSGIPMKPGSARARMILGLQEPPRMTVENLTRGIETEEATAFELSKLDSRWFVFHSRRLPGTVADVDHVVVGPPGVILIDSKYRSGDLVHDPRPASAAAEFDGDGRDYMADYLDRVFGATGRSGSSGPWTLNGRPADSMATAAVFEAACIDDLLDMPEGRLVTPVVVAVHGAKMSTDRGRMDVYDNGRYCNTVTVVHGAELVPYLQSLPSLGKADAFTEDLASVVDYLLPRK
ncbi:MAG: nuclease-related domain-containing protein [Candidatus Nanopelagicales bacterium]